MLSGHSVTVGIDLYTKTVDWEAFLEGAIDWEQYNRIPEIHVSKYKFYEYCYFLPDRMQYAIDAAIELEQLIPSFADSLQKSVIERVLPLLKGNGPIDLPSELLQKLYPGSEEILAVLSPSTVWDLLDDLKNIEISLDSHSHKVLSENSPSFDSLKSYLRSWINLCQKASNEGRGIILNRD
jgi:hypothetical protein